MAGLIPVYPVFEVYRSYEIADLPWSGPGENFRFRVEVLRRLGLETAFFARVYRREHYRIQPTFPQESGEPSLPSYDKMIFVEDDFLIDWNSTESASAAEAVAKVCRRIGQELGVVIELEGV